jgi:hypothetical protein
VKSRGSGWSRHGGSKPPYSYSSSSSSSDDDDDDDGEDGRNDDSSDADDSSEDDEGGKPNIEDNRELERNAAIQEDLLQGQSEKSPDTATGQSPSNEILSAGILLRQTSSGFHDRVGYDPIASIDDLITFTDKAGNCAAHHLAFIGLKKSYAALLECGASKYALNHALVCPSAIVDGVATIPFPSIVAPTADSIAAEDATDNAAAPPHVPVVVRGQCPLPLPAFDDASLKLYRHLTKRGLLPPHLIRAAFLTPEDYSPPLELKPLVDALMEMQKVQGRIGYH